MDETMRKIIIIVIVFGFMIYYKLDYKRYFVFNNDKTKVLTIWKRNNHHSYLIPGKYISPFVPDSNYIIIKNQIINVIFNPKEDSVDYIIGLYPKEILLKDKNLKVYKNIDSILFKYGYLKEIKPNGERIYNNKKDSLIDDLDYKLIDIKRTYGVKIFEKREL